MAEAKNASMVFQTINTTYTPCLIKIQKDYLMFSEHKVLPIIYSIGIVGNILIILISQLLKPKSVINLLLKTLAVFDMMYLVFLFGESMAAMTNRVEIMEEPGWFWMLSSQEAFNGPEWQPPSLFKIPNSKCNSKNYTMYEKYEKFKKDYPCGCGTSVTNFVKHGLKYCELMDRMNRLYGIPNEDELVNTIYWHLDVEAAANNLSQNIKRTNPNILQNDRPMICKELNKTNGFGEIKANVLEELTDQKDKVCGENQSQSACLTEPAMMNLLSELHKVVQNIQSRANNGSEERIASYMDSMILSLKRSWTKQNLCFAYLLHNLTSFISSSLDKVIVKDNDKASLKEVSVRDNTTAIRNVLVILRLQYSSILRNLPQRSKKLVDIKQRFIKQDPEWKDLLYSITAPAYTEIWEEIEKYQAYLESLVNGHGVMMMDWYIRHTLLFNETDPRDARDIYLTIFATKIMARTFQFASACQTVIIALFRYVAICMPYSAPKLCSYKNAVIACLFSFVSAILIHVPHYVLIANDYNSTAHILHIADNGTTDFTSFFTGYHVFFYNIVMFFILPFGLLIFFNFRLVKELYRSSGDVCSSTSRDSENRDATKAVIAVVLVYVVTYIPLPIYIIDKWFFQNGLHLVMVRLDCYCFLVVNFIVWSFPSINSSVNFFIYCLFRSAFRKKVKEVMSTMQRYLACLCPCLRFKKNTSILVDFSDTESIKPSKWASNKTDDTLLEHKSK